MTCSHCDQRASRIAALEDELSAWRAGEADDRRDADDGERVARWRDRLRVRTGAVQVVMLAADRAGRTLRWSTVFAASRTAASRPDVGNERNLAAVAVCHARSGLVGTVAEGGLLYVRGLGVMMTPDVAARLKLAMGDEA